MFLRAVNVSAAMVIVLLCLHSAHAALSPSNGELYDADPNHLWNRLHRALFVRTTADGGEFGIDQLDPLLWYRSTHLLEGPSHENAIAVLDEFLATHGENLVRDPLKRAILQRDLWAVFDWTAESPASDAPEAKPRQDLQRRLSAVIRRLALTKEQIDSLPDNYADAAQSRVFENDYDENKPETPFLPADLFATNGPWVCVGLNSEEQIAPVHVSRFGGRAAFFVFMRTPGGRQEATNYLRQFREFPRPYVYETNQFFTNRIEAVLTTNLPQFPNGTTFALVRQMILVDQNGGLVPTHLTESVQFRRYNDVHPKRGPNGRVLPGSQSMFEFLLSRKQLFTGMAGGLRAVAPDERDFLQFMDKGFDPFDDSERKHGPVSLWFHQAMDCMGCHGNRGVFSVNSFTRLFQNQTSTLPQVVGTSVQWQRDAAPYWKQTQFSWGLLQGLWAQSYTAPAEIRAAAANEHPVGAPHSASSTSLPDPTLLHFAATLGLTNEVELLISRGADVNDKGSQGTTPLADMAAGAHTTDDDQAYADVAAILLAHGAKVDAPDEFGETPLLRAVEFGKPKLAQVLMERGASLSNTFSGTYSRLTPLSYAVEEGKKDMAALILKFKPPLETVDPEGETPLLWAVKRNKLEMTRLLLEHGASVTPTTNLANSGLPPAQLSFINMNNLRNTPLHWALLFKDQEMISLLLQFKAPLDVANRAGETPLDMVKRLDDKEINEIFHRAASTTGAETTTIPSREAMQAVAKRIASDDPAAFDELSTIADNLYLGINYKKDRARLLLNSDRLRAAFSVLGQEAAGGNEKAFQAIKKSLGNRHLKSFAPDALAIAAGAGHKESLEILLHHDEYGILASEANLALEPPATANLEPVVDYFAAMLLNPANAHRGVFGAAKMALKNAAAKGNQKAKSALDQYAAALANKTTAPF